MLQSELGKALLHEEAMPFQINDFLVRCHERASDLIQSGFTEEGVSGYNAAAGVEIGQLKSAGHNMYQTKAVPRNISFLTAEVASHPTSFHDVRDRILEAAARWVAISNGQMDRPHGEMCCGAVSFCQSSAPQRECQSRRWCMVATLVISWRRWRASGGLGTRLPRCRVRSGNTRNTFSTQRPLPPWRFSSS